MWLVGHVAEKLPSRPTVAVGGGGPRPAGLAPAALDLDDVAGGGAGDVPGEGQRPAKQRRRAWWRRRSRCRSPARSRGRTEAAPDRAALSRGRRGRVPGRRGRCPSRRCRRVGQCAAGAPVATVASSMGASWASLARRLTSDESLSKLECGLRGELTGSRWRSATALHRADSPLRISVRKWFPRRRAPESRPLGRRRRVYVTPPRNGGRAAGGRGGRLRAGQAGEHLAHGPGAGAEPDLGELGGGLDRGPEQRRRRLPAGARPPDREAVACGCARGRRAGLRRAVAGLARRTAGLRWSRPAWARAAGLRPCGAAGGGLGRPRRALAAAAAALGRGAARAWRCGGAGGSAAASRARLRGGRRSSKSHDRAPHRANFAETRRGVRRITYGEVPRAP